MLKNMYQENVAIQLQATNLSGKVIVHDETVIFNQIYLQTPYGICYDYETGYIWIIERGYYFVAWNLSLVGASDVNELSFTLKNVYDNKGITISAPVVLANQISGYSLLWVNSFNQSYQLVNSSGGEIQFANTNPQVNLVIYKI